MGYECSGCAGSISGVRFQCVCCIEHNLCINCAVATEQEDTYHVFDMLATPSVHPSITPIIINGELRGMVHNKKRR
eukprot:NODE_2489_length_350_cov_194.995516_g2479_i0.p1 GENE.NODE_2489_length_350_cov_194.995516_g2479_i0~~NODE_2489_length_350_cov_194.995516_g2479_i0.p1  ORF type:complete len:88 (-),score=29.23 NODE_2489_length_350_cov_194.995516_g2479_i0:87-314(-)